MPGETITVELFVRSLSPAGARDRPATLADRLETLAEAGRIDDYKDPRRVLPPSGGG